MEVLDFLPKSLGLALMSLPAASSQRVRFGDFVIDLHTGELGQSGHKVVLQGQPFQILAILLEWPDELVTREELKKRLWPSDTFVDFDHSLNKAVQRLREALADSTVQPRYIETLPRRGYRLIAEVSHEGLKNAPRTPSPDSSAPASISVTTSDGAPLDSAQLSTPSAKSGPSGGFRKRSLFATVGGLVILLSAAVLVLRHRIPKTRPLSFENLEITRLTNNGKVHNVAISPDGRYVAYTVYLGEKQELRLRQLATQTEVQILPPERGNFVGLKFSPDGSYIYFVRSDKNDISFRYLYSVPSLGGTPRKLITDVDSNIGFSPDGREIAYDHGVPALNETELKIAKADGTGDRVLAVIHNTSLFTTGGPAPVWSPNGRTIALAIQVVKRPHLSVLFAVSTADGSIHELYADSDYLGQPVWGPAGDSLLVPQYDASSHKTQLSTISFPAGKSERLTHDASDYSGELDATRDRGTLVSATATAWSKLGVSTSANLTKVQEISSGDPPLFLVRTNREGKVLATDSGGVVWTMNSDGKGMTKLADLRDVNSLMPCEGSVVLTSRGAGAAVLTRLDPDGTHATQLTTGNLWSPTCSLDGKFVYYVNLEQPEKIWRIGIEGGATVAVATVLGDTLMGNVSVSPDGKLLAYPYTTYTTTSPGRHLAIVRVADGSTVKSFDLPGDNWNAGPYWTPDSKAVQYVLIQDGIGNIWQQSVDGGSRKQLTRFTSGETFDFAWSADGTQLFVTRGNIASDVVLLSKVD